LAAKNKPYFQQLGAAQNKRNTVENKLIFTGKPYFGHFLPSKADLILVLNMPLIID
jgi:hypothetical protein